MSTKGLYMSDTDRSSCAGYFVCVVCLSLCVCVCVFSLTLSLSLSVCRERPLYLHVQGRRQEVVNRKY